MSPSESASPTGRRDLRVVVPTALLILAGGYLLATVALRAWFYDLGEVMAEAKVGAFGCSNQIDLYRKRHGRYPASLSEAFGGRPIPTDPWGNRYSYESDSEGEGFLLYSLGRDSRSGGSGEDSDFVVFQHESLIVFPDSLDASHVLTAMHWR